MLFWRILFRINSIIKKAFYKVIYGKKIKFGKNVLFRKGLSIIIDFDGSVEIGDGCFFNNYCSINAQEKIVIENNCLFGEGVKIYDHNHMFNKKEKLIKEQGFTRNTITIGKNCWIGSNVTILKNAKIGENCVIGANVVVNKDIGNDIIVKNNENYLIESIEYKL